MKKTALVIAMTAAINANAETYQAINTDSPTDISTGGNWMVVSPRADQFHLDEIYVSFLDDGKPIVGWMNKPSRGKWVSTSYQSMVQPIGEGPLTIEAWLKFYKSGRYCMQGNYFADDEVINIELWGDGLTVEYEDIPYMCAGGKCNALKQAAVGTYWEIEFLVIGGNREDFPIINPEGLDANLWVTWINHGGRTGFASDVFVRPGACKQEGYVNEAVHPYQNPVDYPERLGLAEIASNDPWRVPVSGDWNCDGKDGIGWYLRDIGKFHLWNGRDMTGEPDHNFWFGPKKRDWTPVAGDWNGDGCDTVAIYNPDNGQFYMKYSHSNGSADDYTWTR